MRLLPALIALVAAALASLLVWLAARDLREPWVWPAVPTPDPDDDVQADPYLVSRPIGRM